MTEPSRGSLHGIRVVEFGGGETFYAGKLLAEQGADVLLLEPADGHPGRQVAPFAELGDAVISTSFMYLNSSKRLGRLPTGAAQWRDICGNVDVVLIGGRQIDVETAGFDLAATRAAFPGLVVTTVTPFGWTGPYAHRPATDLTLSAMGGLMSMGGYADGRPLRAPAGQAYVAASLFAAIATLAQLSRAGSDTRGEHIDVSVQESVAMALENLAQFYDLEGRVRSRHGGTKEQAGRGTYGCADGYMYLMAGVRAEAKFWFALVDWLEEEGAPGGSALREQRWLERDFLEQPEAEKAFASIFEPFCALRTREELYAQARTRGIPFTPVNQMSDVLVNEQLASRDFWQPDRSGHGTVPGAPYRMSATPWQARTDDGSSMALAGAAQGLRASVAVESSADLADLPASAAWSSSTARDRRPLAGIRVVDFCWVGAGSYTTRILSDLGADVVKIESKQRLDQIRLTPPFRDGIPGVNRSGYFADRNAGKRSVTINVKTPQGRALALDLIRDAHVVANNFSPGTMDRLGLGYDVARTVNEDVIYVEMSMQGTTGPHRRVGGYGMTIGALTGLQGLVGEPDRPPTGTGTNYPDHVPSPGHAAFAICVAIRHWRQTGAGQYVDLAQTEATLAVLGPYVLAASLGAAVEPQANQEPGFVFSDAVATADAPGWIAISVATSGEWDALCGVLGTAIPLTPPGTADAARTLRAALEDITSSWPTYELFERLQQAGVVAGVVQTSRELIERDPQLRYRGHWKRLPHREIVECLYNALPFRFDGVDTSPNIGSPLLGEHTKEVIASIGVPLDDIDQLIASGVLD